MKAILMSIKPKWVERILNGEKTIEIRKRFPKDYVGWVYIYCTKGDDNNRLCEDEHYGRKFYLCGPITHNFECLNGKVVARFWCDKVEHIEPHIINWEMKHETDTLSQDKLLKQAQLGIVELIKYCGGIAYAIHISKLEIFDKPKEISGFRKPMEYTKYCNHNCSNCDFAGFNNKTQKWEFECSLTKAPQSWCWVEA